MLALGFGSIPRTLAARNFYCKVHLLGVLFESLSQEVMWPFVTLSCLATLKSRFEDYLSTSPRSFRHGFTQSVYTR